MVHRSFKGFRSRSSCRWRWWSRVCPLPPGWCRYSLICSLQGHQGQGSDGENNHSGRRGWTEPVHETSTFQRALVPTRIYSWGKGTFVVFYNECSITIGLKCSAFFVFDFRPKQCERNSWTQVWSLTQFYSVDFSKSRIAEVRFLQTHNRGLRQL